MERILSMLGLAHKAGRVEIGEEPVGSSARAKKARVILVASDAAAGSVRRAMSFANTGSCLCLVIPAQKDELGRALGRTSCAMAAVTDFVLEHCPEEGTVYLNVDSDGYSGTTFAYSDPAHPQLQSMILWESSVPSTHGFPTGIWSSEYVMVTDKTDEGGIVGPINAALRGDTPASAHYEYVTQFPLNGVTLYCYRRTSPPDQAEADYFKQVFAGYDARWPELFSQRIDAYLAALAG